MRETGCYFFEFLPTFYAMQTVRIKIIKGFKCKSKAKKQP